MSSADNFKRRLNLLDLTLIGLGAIFGSGWLFASSHVASAAGPAGIISWLLGAVAVFLLGLMYCELGAAIPTSSGILKYPMMSHGPIAGYMVGLITVVAYSSIVAIEVVAARQYASAWFPNLTVAGRTSPTTAGWLVQFGLLCCFMLANYFSVKAFAWANNIVSLFKFLVPACVIYILFSHFNADNFTAYRFAPTGFDGIGSAITTSGVIFAYLGLTPIISSASEVKNPKRNVPLALLLSVLGAAVIYTLLQAAFIGAVPSSMLQGGGSGVAAQMTLPFRDIALLLGVMWLATIVVADAVVSPTGCGNIFMHSTSRIVCGWGDKERGMLSKVDERSGVPRRALWFTFALAVAWTLPFPSWEKLVGVVSAALILSYALAPVSVAALRGRSFERPFKVRCLALLGPVSFFIATMLVYWSGWDVMCWLSAGQILMFVVYLALSARRKPGAVLMEQAKSALWIVVYYAGLMVFTKLKHENAVDESLLIAVMVAFSVAIYFWGAASLYNANELVHVTPDIVPDIR